MIQKDLDRKGGIGLKRLHPKRKKYQKREAVKGIWLLEKSTMLSKRQSLDKRKATFY